MKNLMVAAATVLLAAGICEAQAQQGQTNAAKTQAPATQAAPAGPKVPQAKSQEEFKAYEAVMSQKDPVAMDSAASEFATKYPESELREPIFQQLCTVYDAAGASDKSVELARKTLQINPNNAVALVTLAGNLAEHTKENDLDRNERLDESIASAKKALGLIPDMSLPTNYTPDQVAQIKDMLRSWSYDAIGMASYMKKDYPASEEAFTKSTDLQKTRPNPVTYLRLSLAQDKQTKYTAALASIDQCLVSAPKDSPVENLAKQEKERLTKLTAAAPKQ
jgi:tetratricopeptide (TPR) repeat protein